MINRALIRLKVVQVLYSGRIKQESQLAKIEKELKASMDKSYELYNMLLGLIIDLTDQEERLQDEAKNKYFPLEEDLHPNTKFVNNKIAEVLRNEPELSRFRKETGCTWNDNEIFLRLMLDKIKHSELYVNYMNNEQTDLEEDFLLWKEILKTEIYNDDTFRDELETRSVYWNDDLEVMGQFAIKTLKRIEENQEMILLPKFKNEDDEKFAFDLLSYSLREIDQNDGIINQFVKEEKWAPERIGMMERLIMDVALSEIKNFDSIPVNVSLNEYIEITKSYCSAESGRFVNGILHYAVQNMKKHGEIRK